MNDAASHVPLQDPQPLHPVPPDTKPGFSVLDLVDQPTLPPPRKTIKKTRSKTQHGWEGQSELSLLVIVSEPGSTRPRLRPPRIRVVLLLKSCMTSLYHTTIFPRCKVPSVMQGFEVSCSSGKTETLNPKLFTLNPNRVLMASQGL